MDASVTMVKKRARIDPSRCANNAATRRQPEKRLLLSMKTFQLLENLKVARSSTPC
jgi:hypothetical protein